MNTKYTKALAKLLEASKGTPAIVAVSEFVKAEAKAATRP